MKNDSDQGRHSKTNLTYGKFIWPVTIIILAIIFHEAIGMKIKEIGLLSFSKGKVEANFREQSKQSAVGANGSDVKNAQQGLASLSRGAFEYFIPLGFGSQSGTGLLGFPGTNQSGRIAVFLLPTEKTLNEISELERLGFVDTAYSFDGRGIRSQDGLKNEVKEIKRRFQGHIMSTCNIDSSRDCWQLDNPVTASEVYSKITLSVNLTTAGLIAWNAIINTLYNRWGE